MKLPTPWLNPVPSRPAPGRPALPQSDRLVSIHATIEARHLDYLRRMNPANVSAALRAILDRLERRAGR